MRTKPRPEANPLAPLLYWSMGWSMLMALAFFGPLECYLRSLDGD